MKKKHAEHVNLERWLVSYADFITLLFAFFVVMYALSMENLSKVKAAAESIRKAFGGPAVMNGAGGGAGEGTGARQNTKDATLSPFQKEMQDVKEQLDEAATLETGSSDLSERMETLFDGRGLVIRLAAKDFFGREEAGVREDLLPLLDRVGRVIAKAKRPFRIEGFSDPTEARPRGYASGWELSAARAAWVAKYWISRFALDPKLVSIGAYSHYKPLPGESEWALGRNRRVEIVIPNVSAGSE